jgi:hypothetical protein
MHMERCWSRCYDWISSGERLSFEITLVDSVIEFFERHMPILTDFLGRESSNDEST